jgi:hypothetical protein
MAGFDTLMRNIYQTHGSAYRAPGFKIYHHQKFLVTTMELEQTLK